MQLTDLEREMILADRHDKQQRRKDTLEACQQSHKAQI